MSIKAPKGGIISTVNGEFYAGGEFLPDHGKFCGKGRNAVTAERFREVASRAVRVGYRLEFAGPSEEYRLIRRTYIDCRGCGGTGGANYPCCWCNDSGFSDSYDTVVHRAKSLSTLVSVLDLAEGK